MIVSLIAAMARNRVIGVSNRLPWNLPEDLKRFRKLTSAHPVVMGRKTYESIGRPLPNRRNLIVSRNAAFSAPGVEVLPSLEAALEAASAGPGEDEVFVIGGAEIYRLALPRADRLYVTEIEREFEGDAFFPEWDAAAFREVSSEEREDGGLRYRFALLEKCPR